ncbi:MAG: tetratricopeptide repeat protein [Terracidiphilus sp.]
MTNDEQYESAVRLITSLGSDRNEAEGGRLLESAANAGHAKAQALLGSMLRSRGEIGKAIEWLQKAADAGDTDAQVELGMVYGDPNGSLREYGKANACWKSAARSGNGVAMSNLAMLYANGLGVKRSPTKAVLLLMVAAELGNSPALGILKEVAPTLPRYSTPDAMTRMSASLQKLQAIADSGEMKSRCPWVIDNLDNLA